MLTNTVAPARTEVKPQPWPAVLPLKNGVTAKFAGNTVAISYRSQLQSGMDLTDAIKMAQAVLRYAEANGINVQEAADDIRLFPPDWTWEECVEGAQRDY